MATTTIQTGYDFIKSILIDTNIMGFDFVISIIITFLSLMIISRETQKWKLLTFPVIVGWWIAGLRPSIIILIIAIIIYVIEIMSVEVLQDKILPIIGLGAYTKEAKSGKRLEKIATRAFTKRTLIDDKTRKHRETNLPILEREEETKGYLAAIKAAAKEEKLLERKKLDTLKRKAKHQAAINIAKRKYEQQFRQLTKGAMTKGGTNDAIIRTKLEEEERKEIRKKKKRKYLK